MLFSGSNAPLCNPDLAIFVATDVETVAHALGGDCADEQPRLLNPRCIRRPLPVDLRCMLPAIQVCRNAMKCMCCDYEHDNLRDLTVCEAHLILPDAGMPRLINSDEGNLSLAPPLNAD